MYTYISAQRSTCRGGYKTDPQHLNVFTFECFVYICFVLFLFLGTGCHGICSASSGGQQRCLVCAARCYRVPCCLAPFHFMGTVVCVHIYLYIHACVYGCQLLSCCFVCKRMYVYICTLYACIYSIYIYVYTERYVYMYIYIYTYIIHLVPSAPPP